MSVYQRNGHWHLSITINGKRIRQAIKEARTRTQAERAERILRDEIFEQRFGVGGFKLFADFVEKSYKPYAKEHKRGYYVELSILNVLIKRFGKQRLIDITPESIEAFKRERKAELTSHGKPRSESTVNRDIAVLSAVFNKAKDFGQIKINPVRSVKYYRNLNSRERVLTEFEEKVLFNTIKDDVKFSRQVEILLYTGMRRGELFKLEWRDVYLSEKEGYVHFRKEITKTNKARDVPMMSNVKKIFEALLKEAGDVQSTDKIFSSSSWEKTKLSTRFREVCDKLGFKDLTVHSLRHTFSTRCEKNGVSVFAQKTLLGHAKLSMTDKYTHVSKEVLKSNLERFETYIKTRKDTQ